MQNKEEKTDIHIEIYIASLVMKRLGKMLNRTKTVHIYPSIVKYHYCYRKILCSTVLPTLASDVVACKSFHPTTSKFFKTCFTLFGYTSVFQFKRRKPKSNISDHRIT